MKSHVWYLYIKEMVRILLSLILMLGITNSYENKILFGVHVSEKDITKNIHDIKRVAELGLDVIRLPIDWSQLEPYKGEFNEKYLEYVSDLIKVAEKKGLRVIIMFSQSPEWANGGKLPFYPPLEEFNIYYARALLFLVKNLKDYSNILGWEIWNEPNSIEFWPTFTTPRKGTYVLSPLKGADEYYKLLNEAYNLVKKQYPNVLILGGSLAGADVSYLERLWENFSGYIPMDGLALHPYTRVDEFSGSHYGYAQYPDQCNKDDPLSPPWCFEKGLEDIRNFLNYKNFNGYIWITEFGVSSGNGRGEGGSEKEQLLFLIKALKILNRRWRGNDLGIKLAIWYRLIDEGNDKFGLYDSKGNIKLSGRFLRYKFSTVEKNKLPNVVSNRLEKFIYYFENKYTGRRRLELLSNIIYEIEKKASAITLLEKRKLLRNIIFWLRNYEDKYYLLYYLSKGN